MNLRSVCAVVAGAFLIGPTSWAQHAGHTIIQPNDIKWVDVPSLPPGAKIAVLEGKMNEEGPITARLKFPANYKVPAHWHPGVERVTVLSGTMNFGMGDKLDPAKTRALGPGSLLIMPAKMPHFVWTKDEAIAQINVMGPWSVNYVNPADDPQEKVSIDHARDGGPDIPAEDVMFSAGAREEQARRGSRERYARRAAAGGFARELTPEVIQFITERNSAYLATAAADGQPYVQHRGGPRGFLRVLDELHIAFADYAGNRQYISIGNLAENERAFLFLMDYAAAARLKLWGRARIVVGDAELLARLADPGCDARVEQAIVFTVAAYDWNCSRYIPRLAPADEGLRSARRAPPG